MRGLALTGCALGAVAGLVAGGAAGAQQRPDSGIRGMVWYGPTCPVQRSNETCERPYAASITIKREPSERVAARVSSGADGRFTVRLKPGNYLLQPRNGKPFPRAQSHVVAVRRHQFTSVTIRFDSGIR